MVRSCFAIYCGLIMYRLYHICVVVYGRLRRPYTTPNMVQPIHYETTVYSKTATNHILFSKY